MTAGKGFDAQAHAAAMRQAGYWRDRSFDDALEAAVARWPGKVAVVADRAGAPARRITYAELDELVGRAAAALRRLGVGPGDVVASQLPNWWEFVVLDLAVARVGAVLNPLMHIFRERELAFMLGSARSKLLVVPETFHNFDFAAMAEGLKPGLPDLARVIVAGGAGPGSFDAVLLGKDETLAPVQRDTAALSALMYTSGTTGSPKGVMHTPNTLGACVNNIATRAGLSGEDVIHMAAPVGHMLGYAAGVRLAMHLGATLVLQDVWNAERAIALMNNEGVTYSGGSTPFLADIVEAAARGGPRPETLRVFLCAGAPIPPALIERARDLLGLRVCSVWGMTETLASTMTEPERAFEMSARSDGRPSNGVEVKVVDADGHELPQGTEGRLMVRGAQSMIGYAGIPPGETFDGEGWMDTGDLARMDAEGYIRISGRTKDVIIRGGENVPVADIENLLYTHPSVLAVALVGYPDQRLGERTVAFIQLRPGTGIDLEAVRAFMAENRVTTQFWPERVEVVETLPRTPSGKIQKFALRERARLFGQPG